MSNIEELFAQQLTERGIVFQREVKFHPDRRWRFDFVINKIAVEIEGGIWNNGRHNRGKGFESDCEKYAEAACLGWTVLRFTGSQVCTGKAIQWLIRVNEDIQMETTQENQVKAKRVMPPVKPKYRDPASGKTWSGRGRTASWMAEYIKQGRTKEEFVL